MNESSGSSMRNVEKIGVRLLIRAGGIACISSRLMMGWKARGLCVGTI